MPEKCPSPGIAHDCVNVERLKGSLNVRISVIESKIDDQRLAMSRLPREVAELIERERQERMKRLTRGEVHFDEIFTRLNKLERAVLALWIMVGIVGAGRLLVWLFPALSQMF